MTNFTKTTRTLAALLVSGTALTGIASAAELSANIGVTNDYIWRGITQSAGTSSVSGGLDVDFGNGFAAGTWIADVDIPDSTATQEQDYYISYSGEAGGLNYDVGYILYTYDADDSDFDEVYITVGAMGLSASYYYLLDADFDNAAGESTDAGDSTYISVDYETEVGGYGVGVHYGVYDFEDLVKDSEESTDMSVSLSKDDFTIAYITTDDLTGKDDEDRFVISWGTSF